MNMAKASAKASPKRSNIENMYPLSPMQEGLLFHSLLSPTAGTYVPQIVLSFSGQLDGNLLQQAWEKAVTEHSILRTGFYWEQREQPFQVVYRQPAQAEKSWIEKSWIEQDWQQLSAVEQSAKLQILLDCNRSEPFNLNQPPLMRLYWVHRGDNRYYLIWCYHHLILDGWSASQLLKEVFQSYFSLRGNSFPATRAVSYPYGDYIAWLNQQNIAEAESFWQRYLQDWEGSTSLPILKAQRVSPQEQNAQRQPLADRQRPLSEKTTQKLKAFAQTHKITLNTIVQAALGLVLSRYCDTPDVVFGATCAGRPSGLAGAVSMVGLFINTLPVRVQVEKEAGVMDWLRSLSAQQATTTDYEYVSLRSIQSLVNQGNSLFDTLLVFESYPVSADMFTSQTDLQLENIQFNEWTHFPLTILVSGEQQLTFTAKYRADQLASEAVSRLLGHLNNVMMAFMKKSTHKVKEISLLCAAEKKQLASWNQTAVEGYPLDQSLPDLFEAQVAKSPETIALIFEGKSLTYQALNEQANQLAHYLQAVGIGPEQRVAVYLDRSLEMAIAVLAIVKSGAAYVPLDPSYPEERLIYMFGDADVSAVVFEGPRPQFWGSETKLGGPRPRNRGSESRRSDVSWIEIKLCWISDAPPNSGAGGPSDNSHTQPLFISIQSSNNTDEKKLSIANPQRTLSPHNSAYVIYTSGSTGQPKGVINTHQGIVNRLCWMQQTYALTEGARTLHKTPLSFDVSVWEIFWPLLNGATMVIAKPNSHKDSAYLADLIQTQNISVSHFVPSMLTAFLETSEASDCTTLQHVICSGEALSPALQEHFFQKLPNTALHNLYGPTEAAIDVTAWQCQPDSPTVPIGRPIANTQIHLLDSDLNLVPIGVPGELHIGGIGVAQGYHNRPELTAERFIPNPFSPPHPLTPSLFYKSGDLARYLPDGNIEYLGRRDGQIKLRGVRMELGEIEAALMNHPAIRQAVVVHRKEISEEGVLVAYLVGEEDCPPELTQKLPTFLKSKLPEVMVPAMFVSIEALPLTPSGKLDRRTLPQPERLGSTERVAPRNETERAIASIWSTVLPIETTRQDISIYDNFFDLGGHSLSATRVNTRLRKHFDIPLPLQSSFEHPTVESLATHIDALKITTNIQPNIQLSAGHKEIEL